MPEQSSRRLLRLGEELKESGLRLAGSPAFRAMLVEEIDHALRPPVHERRVASLGTILDPMSSPATWAPGTQLEITRQPLNSQPLAAARRFVDGLSSWLVRRTDGSSEWLVFDRPAGSERDLVVLASVLEATLVQRHPVGSVRVVGSFGVLRSVGLRWHHEPPVSSWIDAITACEAHGDPRVLEAMLEFAVHDLGSIGIGSLLIYRPSDEPGPRVEERLPTPPPLRIGRAAHLAPLRHALAQVDGAAIFDAQGRTAPAGRAPGAQPGRGSDRRRPGRNPPHLRPSVQPRRSARHRHRGKRERSGHCAPRGEVLGRSRHRY